ncbi:MAG TPA: cobyrinate a,c-diamide synthase [Azospirillaceae bacterium]|nr:cobyrinate a,c-diamide synthase [Azospirillaceae bacterium]
MTLAPGIIIAAPASGCGKTTVTLALLRHFRNARVRVASCKVGPDYIDPRFHEAASGRPCYNLDPWGMRRATLARLGGLAAKDADLLVAEGVMGLFDGAADGTGSTADIAAMTGWPVVVVMDVKRQAQTAAAVLQGLKSWRNDVNVAGVILNRVGSPMHVALLKDAIAPTGVPVLGCLPGMMALTLPERHLGLVQACEHDSLDTFLEEAADHLARHVDLEALRRLARPAGCAPMPKESLPPPLGQRIAVAQDMAFAFAYPHLLESWRAQGAEVIPFSPLADESPDPAADAVYLPGGYPELHAGRLAGNHVFLDGARGAAARGVTVYGECGGFMVLGRGFEDAEGRWHAMAGLLPVTTSFARRRLHLGYRRATLCANTPLGPAGTVWRGHEFHYATLKSPVADTPLFDAWDARGQSAGALGAVSGTVMGSFLHLVDRA